MGEKLFDQVISCTGLPEDPIRNELGRLLETAGLNEAELTLDQLREVLANYLLDILPEAQESIEILASE